MSLDLALSMLEGSTVIKGQSNQEMKLEFLAKIMDIAIFSADPVAYLKRGIDAFERFSEIERWLMNQLERKSDE